MSWFILLLFSSHILHFSIIKMLHYFEHCCVYILIIQLSYFWTMCFNILFLLFVVLVWLPHGFAKWLLETASYVESKWWNSLRMCLNVESLTMVKHRGHIPGNMGGQAVRRGTPADWWTMEISRDNGWCCSDRIL